VYIVENVQTGLAFGDEPGAAVFMGLGYGVGLLARLPWVARAQCIYWGDLDTHGFAILDRARASVPHLESALMDEETLLAFRDLWVHEREQTTAGVLPMLSPTEQEVYRGLKDSEWVLTCGWNRNASPGASRGLVCNFCLRREHLSITNRDTRRAAKTELKSAWRELKRQSPSNAFSYTCLIPGWFRVCSLQ